MAYLVKYIPKTEKDFNMIALAFGISLKDARKADYKIEKITRKDITEKKKANAEVFKRLSVINDINKILIDKKIIDPKDI